MIQLYFLSIVCNGLSGYLLYAGNEDTSSDVSLDKSPQFSLKSPLFHLVLGIISAATGVLKLLSPSDGIPVFGDLLPAAAGIVAGLSVIFGIYRRETSTAVSETTGMIDRLGSNLMRSRKPIGIGLMASALIHFIFGKGAWIL